MGTSNSELGTQAFRWTSGGGMVGLGNLGGGYSEAHGVSADGSVVVGYSMSTPEARAFRWTDRGGMLSLGVFSGGKYSYAYGTSADGSVVVGYGVSASGDEAFVWDSVHGMRNLKTVLVNDYGLSLTGWTLTRATSVSADGDMIVGYGTNPSGQTEAWLAQIPEPTTWALVALGAVALVGGRRLRSCSW